MVNISKLASNDSAITMMGNIYYFWSNDSNQMRFSNGPFGDDYVYFSKFNDSIWFCHTVGLGNSHHEYYYYAGYR